MLGGYSPRCEAIARAVNTEPWERPPGMEKRQCLDCRCFFASLPDAEIRTIPLCQRGSPPGPRGVTGNLTSQTDHAARRLRPRGADGSLVAAPTRCRPRDTDGVGPW
jgi:hypothetical protein